METGKTVIFPLLLLCLYITLNQGQHPCFSTQFPYAPSSWETEGTHACIVFDPGTFWPMLPLSEKQTFNGLCFKGSFFHLAGFVKE